MLWCIADQSLPFKIQLNLVLNTVETQRHIAQTRNVIKEWLRLCYDVLWTSLDILDCHINLKAPRDSIWYTTIPITSGKGGHLILSYGPFFDGVESRATIKNHQNDEASSKWYTASTISTASPYTDFQILTAQLLRDSATAIRGEHSVQKPLPDSQVMKKCISCSGSSMVGFQATCPYVFFTWPMLWAETKDSIEKMQFLHRLVSYLYGSLIYEMHWVSDCGFKSINNLLLTLKFVYISSHFAK